MTTDIPSITSLTTVWDESLTKPDLELPGIGSYAALYEYLRFLAVRVYSDFERDLAPGVRPFLSRLDEWVTGARADDDRRTLLEAALSIRYAARDEVHALYQIAYRGHLARWLMDHENVRLADSNSQDFDDMVRRVWIGAGSDSFHLDTFFHITGAPSASERRPSWLELAEFATKNKVSAHMGRCKFKYIAIFEDFVGSGVQIEPAIEFALSIPGKPMILVCPMFAGAASRENLQPLVDSGRVTYDPVVTLSGQNLLPKDQPSDEEPHLESLRDCLVRIHGKVHDPPHPITENPFGFRGVGSLLVQYSNTPDNCPPALWNDNENWTALFPRKPRGGFG